jgi:hypothetical protein
MSTLGEKPVAEPTRILSADSLLGEAAEEFMDRVARDEPVQIEEYAARYPQIAAVIRQVFPALEVMRSSASAMSSRANSGESGVASDTFSLPTGCLGDFRIIREIGRGGMGIVYEAEQTARCFQAGSLTRWALLTIRLALGSRQIPRATCTYRVLSSALSPLPVSV